MSSTTIGTIVPENLSEMARHWVDELLSSLLEQGRVAEGGWPGTVSEAQSRVREYARARQLQLSSGEGARLARTLNQDARSKWRLCSRRASPVAFTE